MLLLATSFAALAPPADASFALCHGNLTTPTGNEACGLTSFCGQPNVDCAPGIDHDYACTWDTRTASVSCGLV